MSNTRTCIYALHGFLGQPDDWDTLRRGLLPNTAFYPVKLSDFSASTLSDSAKHFNQYVQQQSPLAHNILMGYSLGGRLALHALLDNPTLWQRAILISANPGLKTHQERQERLEADEQWARRFETAPWDDLMADWNRQAIFQEGFFPKRSQEEANRPELARQLRDWSMGHQADLREAIASLPHPLLWIAGEKDRKYVQSTQALSFHHPKSKIWIAPGVSHRVLWEATDELRGIINTW
jgi:2-succinyl-6-hydroxy-2,4-cyclohexadiene-1-carboxylate synthase